MIARCVSSRNGIALTYEQPEWRSWGVSMPLQVGVVVKKIESQRAQVNQRSIVRSKLGIFLLLEKHWGKHWARCERNKEYSKDWRLPVREAHETKWSEGDMRASLEWKRSWRSIPVNDPISRATLKTPQSSGNAAVCGENTSTPFQILRFSPTHTEMPTTRKLHHHRSSSPRSEFLMVGHGHSENMWDECLLVFSYQSVFL